LHHAALARPGVEFVSGKIEICRANGSKSAEGTGWEWKRFSRFMNIAHPGALHSRVMLDKLGKFDTTYRSAADYELLLRAGCTLQTAFVDEVVVRMSAGGVSDSFAGLYETQRAKISSGARSRVAAIVDRYIATIKLSWRKQYQSSPR